MIKVHSTVGLITNSSTVIFTDGAFQNTADSIRNALRQLLMVIGSDLSVEDILNNKLLQKELVAGLSEADVAHEYDDNELYSLVSLMEYGDYERH